VPKTSIILLTKNAGDLFPEVLEGLFCCAGIEEAEVILIDSGSVDRTLSHAARYPRIQTHEIPPETFSHGRARNLGARLATGEILIFLVQDATPVAPDFLTALVAPLADPRVAASYGRQVPRPSANPVEQHFLEVTYPDTPSVRAHDASSTTTLHSIFFSNVCSAIRRQVWEEIPFDEGLIMSEDQNWAKEALRRGYLVVYQPAAAVHHSHSYNLIQILQRNFDSGCSLVGIIEDSPHQMASYELKHLVSGIEHLLHGDRSAWIPYFFLHETIRSVGFALGTISRWLPRRVSHHLSLHKAHWSRVGAR
jgi:rhamnosyltransferase